MLNESERYVRYEPINRKEEKKSAEEEQVLMANSIDNSKGDNEAQINSKEEQGPTVKTKDKEKNKDENDEDESSSELEDSKEDSKEDLESENSKISESESESEQSDDNAKEEGKIKVKDAKNDELYKTDILDHLIKGWLEKMNIVENYSDTRDIYKVSKQNERYLFVSTEYDISKEELVKQAKKEYKDLEKLANHYKNIAKPIEYKSIKLKKLNKIVVEYLYEYKGQDIYHVLKDRDVERVLDVMVKVLEPMKVMEEKNACNGNLRPEFILVNNDNVIIVNIGNQSLNEEESKEKSKTDVYTWGIILYHLFNKDTDDNLKSAIDKKLSSKDYKEAVKELKGNDVFIKMLIDILLKVLDKEPENRPSFKELIELMKPLEVYYKKEFNSLKEMIIAVNEKEGTHIIDYRKFKEIKGRIPKPEGG